MAIKITPKQSRKINTRIHKCCANCFDGNCLLLDDGETCPCIQLISRYRLYCNYFKNAVLPADEALYAEIMKPQTKKRCVVCGTAFVPKSNRQKYCPDCSAAEERKKDRLRKQKNGIAVSAFRQEKERSRLKHYDFSPNLKKGAPIQALKNGRNLKLCLRPNP